MPALSAPSAKILIVRSLRGFMRLVVEIELLAAGVGKNNAGGVGEAFHGEVRLGAQLFHVTEINEHRAHAGVEPGVNVAPAVADQPRACKIESEIARRFEKHSRLRLAPWIRWSAGQAGGVTNVNPLDLGN